MVFECVCDLYVFVVCKYACGICIDVCTYMVYACVCVCAYMIPCLFSLSLALTTSISGKRICFLSFFYIILLIPKLLIFCSTFSVNSVHI